MGPHWGGYIPGLVGYSDISHVAFAGVYREVYCTYVLCIASFVVVDLIVWKKDLVMLWELGTFQ